MSHGTTTKKRNIPCLWTRCGLCKREAIQGRRQGWRRRNDIGLRGEPRLIPQVFVIGPPTAHGTGPYRHPMYLNLLLGHLPPPWHQSLAAHCKLEKQSSPSSRPSTHAEPAFLPLPHKHADARPCPPQELLLSICWLRDSEQQWKGRTIQRWPQPRRRHVRATAGIRELAESTCVTSQPAAGSGCSALARPAALLARAGRGNARSKWIRSWGSSPAD